MMLKDTYDVITANSGQQCLKIIQEHCPNLVILDIRLPDANGLDLLKVIKKEHNSLPVIIITGVGTHRMAIDALKSGAADFIAKPLNFYYVRSIIACNLSGNGETHKDLPTAEEIIIKNYHSSINSLNKILAAKDPFTREHSKRVSVFAMKMAQELGLSEDQQEVMRETALLHDIGKVGIAEAILNKPGRLNAQEWMEVKKHTQLGEEFLEPLKILHIEQSMIRHHHERYDGKGYPDHLKGEEIPLYARILAVADAYEAMTSDRPYRRAINPIEALSELERCSGSQFDPKIVETFVQILKREKSLLLNNKREV
ncbi:MAG: response regulator, partial [Candidatus Omnitrophica bacterium]|nr:response regulator [Candidatus Omnitrophota bacterium]